MKRTVLLAALALSIADPSAAQTRSTHQGFILGLGLTGGWLDPEDGETHSGGGLGFDLAYGFGNGISIFAGSSFTRMEPDADFGEEYNLALGDFGVRYAIGSQEAAWRPFIEGGFNYLTATWEDVDLGEFGQLSPLAPSLVDVDIALRGPGLSFGGGVEYFLNPRWALGGGLRLAFGSIDELKIGNVTVELDEEDEFDLSTGRITLGIRYFFRGRGQ
jgi:hypothetical protein